MADRDMAYRLATLVLFLTSPGLIMSTILILDSSPVLPVLWRSTKEILIFILNRSRACVEEVLQLGGQDLLAFLVVIVG
jgi:hypothetical protein